MALSNAERQRKHREDHIGKHRDAQRVANLLKRKHLTGPEDAGRQPAKAGGGVARHQCRDFSFRTVAEYGSTFVNR